ncbi:MAG: macro domain-containing protein, partial [Cyclobacteriaceae bacterium]|nr:macro domain-containing protein [Cyclobacteriaceae bacterium]
LSGAYLNSLKLAEQHHLRSISFPNISTGVYGYPKKEAAMIAIDTVQGYASTGTDLERVVFVCYDQESYRIYEEILQNKGLIP